MRARTALLLTILIVLLLAAIALRLIIWDGGVDSLDFIRAGIVQLFGASDFAVEGFSIRFRLRMVLSACLVGSGLAISGVLLQGLLRNPLAAPSILGITSGAGLGVVLVILLTSASTGAIAPPGTRIAAAIIGAIAALVLVYLIGQRRGVIEPVTLLLAGVIVSVICGALIATAYQFMSDQGVAAAIRWMMGSMVQDVPWIHHLAVGLIIVIGMVIAMRIAPALDVITLGAEEAHSIGVAVPRLRMTTFILAGTLAGVTVLLAGPIGFVGLICPHIARRLVGPGHRTLLVFAALLGAALMVAADLVSTRAAAWSPAGQIPVGVLMALLGGPFFILLLRRRPAAFQGGGP